jgi:hypothetical protein
MSVRVTEFELEWDPRYRVLRISEPYLEDVFKLNVVTEKEASELIAALTYYFFPDKYLASLATEEVHGVG